MTNEKKGILRVYLSRRIIGIVFFLTLLFIIGGCFKYHQTYQETIPIRDAKGLNEELRIAKAIATQERMTFLKHEVRKHFPNIPDEHLRGMYLLWRVTKSSGQSGESVFVVVGIKYSDVSFNTEATRVIGYSKQLLEEQLNEKPTLPLK